MDLEMIYLVKLVFVKASITPITDFGKDQEKGLEINLMNINKNPN